MLEASVDEFRVPMRIKPPRPRDGDPIFSIPMKLVDQRHEAALSLIFICDRRLFGEVYYGLLPEFFRKMPQNSGVLVRPFVRTRNLISSALFPGDIDLLIIPYENDHLLVHMSLALEIKVVRATFARQGKSPNDFGFSQATALLSLGFPYAGVVHIIVSDTSPKEAWRQTMIMQIVDSEGRLDNPARIRADMMPRDLINRAYGRLAANCPREELGLAAIYIEEWKLQVTTDPKCTGIWFPDCRRASHNPAVSEELMRSIAKYYEQVQGQFLDNPRYDPPKT